VASAADQWPYGVRGIQPTVTKSAVTVLLTQPFDRLRMEHLLFLLQYNSVSSEFFNEYQRSFSIYFRPGRVSVDHIAEVIYWMIFDI
jgi:hypothetical protein